MPVISVAQLEQFSTALFRAAGVAQSEAEVVSRSLVGANLRGYDSHGVMRIPFYIGAIKDGRVKPSGKLTIEKETPAILVCDGA